MGFICVFDLFYIYSSHIYKTLKGNLYIYSDIIDAVVSQYIEIPVLYLVDELNVHAFNNFE